MMTPTPGSRLEALFARLVRWRWVIVAAYALLLPGALALALRIPRDNALERMVVAGNADVAATRGFQRLFPEQPLVVLVARTAAPFSAEAIAGVAALQQRLARLPRVTTYSVLTVWERLHPGAAARGQDPENLRHFVGGTDFFRSQGLVGDDFWGVVVALDVAGSAERDEVLAGIDAAIATTLSGERAAVPGAGRITAVGRVGAPFLDSWLERETGAAAVRYFPLFGAFVVLLVLGLYRSWRALAAFLISLGMAVLLGVAAGGLLGFGFTIVSSLVPLTLMVTATASLVYLHSRFVDQPGGTTLAAHRVWALANKSLAVSASVFAATVGFAALAVSEILPIRQLGIWTATGLVIGWGVCFTLYPALQVLLRTPTRHERAVSGGWVARAAELLPLWSYDRRREILAAAALVALAGLIALVGIPGRPDLVAPMRLQVDALDYVDAELPAARDTRAYTDRVLGLTSVSLLVTTPPGAVLEPATLAALDALARELAAEPAVGAVVGLPSVLRLRRYAAGLGDALPRDEAGLAAVAADLEQLLLVEPTLCQWVDTASLQATYLKVTSRAGASGGLEVLRAAVDAAWARASRSSPALGKLTYRLVGSGVLQATIAAHLVPTLVQSFAITFAIIFVTFLLVFRSGPARLTAMLPSLFAILVMFLFMRLAGIPLNVATILIATTVLGATENDQIHFFYHFQERRQGGTTEQAMAHAIRVAGHPILFATLINAGGFLALVLSNLPPMRQFGIVTSAAFVLAMVADFTILPAALWLLFRERPDAQGGQRRLKSAV